MTTHAQPGAAAQGFALHLHLQGGAPVNDADVERTLFRAHAPATHAPPPSLVSLPEKWRQDDETTLEPSNLRRDSAQLSFSCPQNASRWLDAVSLDGGETSPVCAAVCPESASRDDLSETALRSFQQSRFHREQTPRRGTSGNRRGTWQRRFVGRTNVGCLDHMSGSKTGL